MKIVIYILLSILAVLPAKAGSTKQDSKIALTSATATIYQDNTSFVCGDEQQKAIIIAMSIGRIYYADSLIYGFNFGLKYNPRKISLLYGLWNNTIAGLFDLQQITPDPNKGTVQGFAGGMKSKPVAGDLPLFAILGTFINDCPDTSLVQFDYLEMTDGFKKAIDVKIDGVVKANLISGLDNLKISFETDKLVFDKNTEIQNANIKFKANTFAKPDTIDLMIILPTNTSFEVVNVESVSNNFQIIAQSINLDKINVKAFVKQTNLNEAGLNIKFKRISDRDETVRFSINGIKNYSCSCTTGFENSSINLINKKSDTISKSVSNDLQSENTRIMISGSQLNINSNQALNQYQIYNLYGDIIRIGDFINYNYNIDLYNMTNGLYLLRLINDRKEIQNINFIINS